MPSGQRHGPEARGTAAGGRALPPPPPPSASSFVASSRPLFLPPPPSPGPLPLSLSSCLAFLRRKRLIYYKCTFGADISEERRASADERSLRAARRPERGPHGSAEPPAGRGERAQSRPGRERANRAGPLPAAARAAGGPRPSPPHAAPAPGSAPSSCMTVTKVSARDPPAPTALRPGCGDAGVGGRRGRDAGEVRRAPP